MADTVAFELVAPERLLLSEQVEMVVVPGSEGYFGVLPGHAPLISTLNPGVIDVYKGGQITDRIFVDGGFAEVTPERCTVLADHATPVKDLDRGKIEAALKTARDDLGTARDDRERAAAEARLAVLEAQLQALAA
jgi:F-type H+-transporting ATPase subunit epsilon